MPPDLVLTSFPVPYQWTAAPGGFSGATVWKGTAADGSAVALKRWPSDFSVQRLRTIHGWMRDVSHLPFVPRIVPTRKGDTVVIHDRTLWDLSTWMPGDPDGSPPDSRLISAAAALADLHRVWFRSNRPLSSDSTRIPAVQRRLDLFDSFRTWHAAGNRPEDTGYDRLNRKCADAFTLLPRLLPDMDRALRPWRDRPLPTFPCLCDVHAGHVLFTADAVTGVIDYGAMKVDHPAVDLARYLGAATPGDARAFAVGLAAYRAARPPVEVPDELVRLLEWTGAAGGLANWLLRLSSGLPVADPQTVARRMKRMLARLRLAAGPGRH